MKVPSAEGINSERKGRQNMCFNWRLKLLRHYTAHFILKLFKRVLSNGFFLSDAARSPTHLWQTLAIPSLSCQQNPNFEQDGRMPG